MQYSFSKINYHILDEIEEMLEKRRRGGRRRKAESEEGMSFGKLDDVNLRVVGSQLIDIFINTDMVPLTNYPTA